MKSTPALVNAVGDEIREDSWMGTEFKYPAYRVGVLTMQPLTNGECRPSIWGITFVVYAYAEDASSKAASQLIGLAATHLMGKQIRTADITPVTRIDIPSNVTPPVPESDRLWRGEAGCYVQLKGVGP